MFDAHSVRVTRRADRSILKQIGRGLIIILALVHGRSAYASCTASLALAKYDDDRIRFKGTGTASSCPNNNNIELSFSYDGGPFYPQLQCSTSPCETAEFSSGYACLKGTHTWALLVTCGKALPDGSCGTSDDPAVDVKSFSFDHTPSITSVETNADDGISGYVTGAIHYHAPAVAGNLAVTAEWIGGSSGVNCCFPVYPEGEFGNTPDYWSPFSGPPDGSGSTMLLLTVTECSDKKVSTVINAVDNDCGCTTGAGSQYSASGSGPAACAGKPIRLSNGNMRMTDRDPLPANEALFLGRTYDSRGVTGFFGNGWTSPFDARLRVSRSQSLGTTFAEIRTPSNSKYLFQNVDGGWLQMWPRGTTPAVLSAGAGMYTLREPQSAIETTFDSASGRLVRARSRALGGREAVISYVNGLPTRVADSWGDWAWTIAPDTANRISTITVDGTSLVWTYTYDASGNLASVMGPGSSAWRTYAYTTQGLTEARDARGNLIESHAYDANPYVTRATQSLGDQDDITNIEYLLPGRDDFEKITRTTSGNGATTDYFTRYIAGRPRTVQVVGHCATCGTNDAVYAYDSATGQLLREQDARGFITVRTFDGADRVISTAGPYQPAGCDPLTDASHCRQTPASLLTATLSPTVSTLTTAFAYGDLTWTDVATLTTVVSVLAPNQVRTTATQLDSVTGMVTQQVTTGQTGSPAQTTQYTVTTALYDGIEGAVFNPGGAFGSGWTDLPQPAGLRKSNDGPRTDVADTTTFVYYPVNTAVPATWRGHLAAIRNAAGQVTRFENYDVFGNAGRTVDPNGVATESSYDTIGRLITSTLKAVPGCDTTADPLCATDIVTSRTYQPPLGPLASMTTPGGGTTTYEYDDRGRTTATTRQVSATAYERIEYDYDPATGHKSAERYLGGHPGSWTVTRSDAFQYDSFARLKEIDHSDGSKIVYRYDGANNLISVQDERHTAANTTYSYDPANRLASVTQTLSSAAAGQIATAYAYDVLGNLIAVTDPNGNVTSYVYDDFGRMIRQTSPVTGVTSYIYDAAGNVSTTTDANNATTARTYDALNRVLSAASSKTGSNTETVTYSYDASAAGRNGIGRLTTMTDPVNMTSYSYERRGLLTSAADSDLTTSFTYDADGNRTGVNYPSGRLVHYTFDLAGRPLTASDGTPLISSASYLPFGPVTSIAYGNGTTKTMQYDTRYRVTENKLTTAVNVIADYLYQEDPAGNITQIHDAMNAAYNRDFGYDDINRLTTANSGTSLWGAGTYQYDAMGNITALHIPPRSLSFAYVGSTPKIQGIPYDNAGNDLTAGTYSSRNLLRHIGGGSDEMPDPGQSSPFVDYVYDGRGVRITASVTTAGPPPWGGTKTRRSVYSPELHLLAQSDWTSGGSIVGGESTGTTRALARPWPHAQSTLRAASLAVPEGQFDGTDYIWFGDQPVAQAFTDSSQPTRYTFTDHLGTPILQTDPTATIVWRAEYEPYGSVYSYRVATADDPQALHLPGQEAPDSGLSNDEYNIFRWYRAGWGRYAQADPVGVSGNQFMQHDAIRSTDVFGYADENPLLRLDPTGRSVATTAAAQTAMETGGAVADFLWNYRNMRGANTIGADKYFHCMANCEAARRGPYGQMTALVMSVGREAVDYSVKGDSRAACIADLLADLVGIAGGRSCTSCSPPSPCKQVCQGLRPKGLDPRY